MACGSLPSIETLRQFLSYDPDSGKLFWKVKPSKRAPVSAGSEAFKYVDNQGYKVGGIHGWIGAAHRVGWAIFHGGWATKNLDHINGDRSDNRIANLREVTSSENSMNRRVVRGKSDPYKGIFRRQGKTDVFWYASIEIRGKNKFLGSYKCPTMAALAYDHAAKTEFGEFAGLNFPRKIP